MAFRLLLRFAPGVLAISLRLMMVVGVICSGLTASAPHPHDVRFTIGAGTSRAGVARSVGADQGASRLAKCCPGSLPAHAGYAPIRLGPNWVLPCRRALRDRAPPSSSSRERLRSDRHPQVCSGSDSHLTLSP